MVGVKVRPPANSIVFVGHDTVKVDCPGTVMADFPGPLRPTHVSQTLTNSGDVHGNTCTCHGTCMCACELIRITAHSWNNSYMHESCQLI